MGDRELFTCTCTRAHSLALYLAFPAIEDDAIRADLFRCSQCGQLERDSIGLRFLLLAAASRAWKVCCQHILLAPHSSVYNAKPLCRRCCSPDALKSRRRRRRGHGYRKLNSLTTSEQARLPAEFKHIIKRRKRN